MATSLRIKLAIVLALILGAILATLATAKSTHHRQRSYHCDLLELNHCYDTDGEFKFDQLIAWRWNPEYGRHECEHWEMVKLPQLSVEKRGSSVVATVAPGTKPSHRIYANSYQETWTTIDPEAANRRLYAVRFRVWRR